MAKPESVRPSPYYWVVVADEYLANFYTRQERSAPLQEAGSLRNDAAREKLRDLVSDRDGRGFDSQGAGRHGYGSEKSDAKIHSYVVFAKKIAERIRDGQHKHKFVKLAVIAAPRFLGVLRNSLETAGIEPSLTIDKELTGRDAAFIQKQMDEHDK
jgi:protein required for attachment to host cells